MNNLDNVDEIEIGQFCVILWYIHNSKWQGATYYILCHVITYLVFHMAFSTQ